MRGLNLVGAYCPARAALDIIETAAATLLVNHTVMTLAFLSLESGVRRLVVHSLLADLDRIVRTHHPKPTGGRWVDETCA